MKHQLQTLCQYPRVGEEGMLQLSTLANGTHAVLSLTAHITYTAYHSQLSILTLSMLANGTHVVTT